jgi:hypothetical protein
MTICVSVKVSEGLVLAADSTAAIQGTMQDPTGKSASGILKTYDHVRKLSHIKDFPIGTLTWGAALIGARSVESLIKEYEYTLPSLEEEQEKIKERRMRGESKGDERFEYSVRKIANGLLDHVRKFYEAEFADQSANQHPPLGILVSGYSSGQFFPEQWLINLPFSTELSPVRPDVDGKPDFGTNWFGLTDAIIRLHWGRDEAAFGLLAEHFKVKPEEIRQVLDKLQYPVLFNGMPLQDAIEYAVYVVNVVIGRFRFVVGAPLCGGEIDVAVITPNAFTWIQRKSWHVSKPQ